jgi:tripartite-type tricarboxylate transporter receptor subunit TctC
MNRREFITLLGGGAVAMPRPAFAKSKFPIRPIRLVIPFPPGGGFDAVGRPWADRVKSVLGTVVIENQGGGAGSIGSASVARAKPDGYTILLGGTTTLMTEALLKKRPLYNPVKDLTPISNIAISAFAIAINPAIPVHSLKELAEYAKTNPRKLSYGTAGVGSLGHLTGELLKSLTKTSEMIHVPYRGGGPAITDAMSGQVSMVITAVTAQFLELHQTGKLRILAVTSPGRLFVAPDIPTAVEAGFPDMVAFQFVGLFAPRGTPKAIIDQIGQASRAAVADDAFQKTLLDSGFRPDVDSTPAKLGEYIDYDIAHWGPLIKELGLKID